MIVSLSAVLVLGALVVILWRHAGLRPWHAAVCVLFGFYLASTSLAPYIRDGAGAVGRLLTGIHP
jgi:hypothetical protein